MVVIKVSENPICPGTLYATLCHSHDHCDVAKGHSNGISELILVMNRFIC